MHKIAVIGAGKTGRGFIGRLLSEAGRSILFVDRDRALTDRLGAQQRFEVRFFGNKRPAHTIGQYTATDWEHADFSEIQLLFVAVGGANLTDVGARLAPLLNDGKRRYIITCENASHPAKTLADAIGNPDVAVSEATVFCTTIEDGGLDIASENYPYLQCDAKPLDGFDPQLPGVRPIDGFENFLTRKLFTYNAASCVIAYLGWLKGYEDYGEAANDPEILRLLDRNYSATNAVLCAEFGYDLADQREFAALSKQKFCDRTIADTVTRNAREPQRKLQYGERIIGPALLLEKYHADNSVLCLTAAAALLYNNDSEQAWQAIKSEKTPAQILTDLCGLRPGSPLFEQILANYRRLQSNLHNNKGALL